MNQFLLPVAVVAGFVLAPFVYLFFVRRTAERIERLAERAAESRVEEAEAEARAKLREAELAAKEKLLEARGEFEKIAARERQELEQRERAAARAEDDLARRRATVERAEEDVARRKGEIEKAEARCRELEDELQQLIRRERESLEKIGGLTAQTARDELVRLLQDEARMEAAHAVKRIEDEAREKAHRESQRIIATAIERTASDFVAETTVSVVMLPSDDMKGRIIGREGRNIRTLEMTTGVDLIVDDTPEAVVLSGFDPYRREIARVSLERLIADGRIHPGRIESVVAQVRDEFEQRVQREGESALLELDIGNVDPELVRLLGRLRFRTSYGQNVLAHSREVALLAAAMAAELGVDADVAKRAGLFHDIGKAVDREMEGTHLQIGMDLLRQHGESEAVVHAMACHHGDYEPESVEAVLVTAADGLSAARPGARREVLENYVKRLEQLEELASSFAGVKKTFAIQAGREVRIIVDSENLGDEEAMWLSKDIARKIESELTYPGQIKVTVIRETRSVEIAR